MNELARLMNKENQSEDFQGGARAEINRGTRPVFGASGWTGTECGLVAPVHPLGGLLRLLQHDEKP